MNITELLLSKFFRAWDFTNNITAICIIIITRICGVISQPLLGSGALLVYKRHLGFCATFFEFIKLIRGV